MKTSGNDGIEQLGRTCDASVLEAASWRLASELVCRHPDRLRILRTHPGGGESDCLTVTTSSAAGGVIQLNRRGTIQIHERFDEGGAPSWEPVEWDSFLRDDESDFLDRVERAAGLGRPVDVRTPSPLTLTYCSLAGIAATAIKSLDLFDIQSGFIDTSGYGAGPNSALEAFSTVPPRLLTRDDSDLFGEPGYRFWIVTRNQAPLLAFEQAEGLAWCAHRTETMNLAAEYAASDYNLTALALQLLRFADPPLVAGS